MTLASAIAVKNSLGVLILVALILLIAAPVIKSFMILLIIRVSGALGSICGEKQMMKCVEYISEAGFMLLRILITVTTLFFVTIAAVTNAQQVRRQHGVFGNGGQAAHVYSDLFSVPDSAYRGECLSKISKVIFLIC